MNGTWRQIAPPCDLPDTQTGHFEQTCDVLAEGSRSNPPSRHVQLLPVRQGAKSGGSLSGGSLSGGSGHHLSLVSRPQPQVVPTARPTPCPTRLPRGIG